MNVCVCVCECVLVCVWGGGVASAPIPENPTSESDANYRPTSMIPEPLSQESPPMS